MVIYTPHVKPSMEKAIRKVFVFTDNVNRRVELLKYLARNLTEDSVPANIYDVLIVYIGIPAVDNFLAQRWIATSAGVYVPLTWQNFGAIK